MTAPADFIEEGDAGGRTVRFTGSLTLAGLGDLPERLAQVSGPVSLIDVSDAERIDTIGAWVVRGFARQHDARVEGAPTEVRRLIEEVERASQPVRMRPDPVPSFYRVLEEIGAAVAQAGKTLLGLLAFFGGMIVAAGSVIANPKRFRWNAVIQRFEVVGVSALGIIGLMSFLIGIVIAQQGSVQLQQSALNS